MVDWYTQILNNLFDINNITAREQTTSSVGKLFGSLNVLQDSQMAASFLRIHLCILTTPGTKINDDFYFTLKSYLRDITLNLNSNGVFLSKKGLRLRAAFLNSNKFVQLQNRLTGSDKLSALSKTKTEDIWSSATEIVDNIHNIISNEFEEVNQLSFEEHRDLGIALIRQIAVLFAIFSGLIVFTILLTRGIRNRILKVSDRLYEMSSGKADLTVSIEVDAKDGIGKLAENFNTYLRTLGGLMGQIKESITGLVQISNDLAGNMQNTSAAKDNIAYNLENVTDNINEQTDKMTSLSKAAGLFSTVIEELSKTVEEQSAAITESSASIEEMIANIQSVTKNVDNTNLIINELSSDSVQGSDLITQVSNEINQISKQSSSLLEANALISGIASQTNLLAMNAAIEAAHAGEAGKGFAVVANEIRNLAETASEQSKVISQNISTITESIDSAVTSTQTTETTFARIANKISTATDLQEQIKNAMEEQNQGSSEILSALNLLNSSSDTVNNSTARMSQTGQKMTLDISEITRSNKALNDSFSEMAGAVARIEQAINRFLELGKQNSDYITLLSEKSDKFTV